LRLPAKSFDRFGIREDMIRDQDEEINYRLLNQGGKIWFDPAIRSVLYIRPTLPKLFRQHYQYGYYKPLVALKVGFRRILVQMIPGLFVTALATLSLAAPFSRMARPLAVVSLYGAAAPSPGPVAARRGIPPARRRGGRSPSSRRFPPATPAACRLRHRPWPDSSSHPEQNRRRSDADELLTR
jgi:hypothetical protein